MVPILINFNSVEIGAILVNHFRNEISDKDGGCLPKQAVLYHRAGVGKVKGVRFSPGPKTGPGCL